MPYFEQYVSISREWFHVSAVWSHREVSLSFTFTPRKEISWCLTQWTMFSYSEYGEMAINVFPILYIVVSLMLLKPVLSNPSWLFQWPVSTKGKRSSQMWPGS